MRSNTNTNLKDCNMYQLSYPIIYCFVVTVHKSKNRNHISKRKKKKRNKIQKYKKSEPTNTPF